MLGMRLEAKWCRDVGDAQEVKCMNAWGTKESGEAGELEKRRWYVIIGERGLERRYMFRQFVFILVLYMCYNPAAKLR